MTFVMLVYQGATPLPGSDQWQALPEAEQEAIYADYAELYKTEGVAPGLPLAATMFFTNDVHADYERMKARGAEFTKPPTDMTGSKLAMLNDTCGNLIQRVQRHIQAAPNSTETSEIPMRAEPDRLGATDRQGSTDFQ